MSDQYDHLILKVLSGSATAEEQRQFETWVSQSPDRKKMIRDFQKIWHEESNTPDFRTNSEWEKFEARINQKESTTQLPVRGLFFKVAASILLIAVFSVLIYQVIFRADAIVLQSGDEKQEFSLPDGSRIWLNAKSKISYTPDFAEERSIELMGEAFFEVAHNPEKPFVISTKQSKIRVLGTSFNVSAYERDTVEEVYVATGKVRLTSGELNVDLEPGELGTLNRRTLLLSSQEAPDVNYAAWKTGSLIFRRTSLTDVAHALEHYFNISIVIKNPAIEKCRFTSSFTDPTLEEIIETISLSMNLNVLHQNKEYVFDGEGCGNE